MSKWDPNYHRMNSLPKLKEVLITIGIVIASLTSVVIAERVAYSITFPSSSETVEIDRNTFYIETMGWRNIYDIVLKTDTNEDDVFPKGINATRVWCIPILGRFWSWREYEIIPLLYNNYSSASASLYTLATNSRNGGYFTLEIYDVIVEVNASQGRLFYLHVEADSPLNY